MSVLSGVQREARLFQALDPYSGLHVCANAFTFIPSKHLSKRLCKRACSCRNVLRRASHIAAPARAPTRPHRNLRILRLTSPRRPPTFVVLTLQKGK